MRCRFCLPATTCGSSGFLRFVADGSAAEDLVSEVFLDVWRQAGRFEGRSRVTTWLLGIARYKALSALQRRSTEELGEDVAAAIEDPQDNPEVTIKNRQTSEILLDCLKKLSQAHREVIDLVYYHEKSIDEVAEITGIPPNTVKTRMFYARKRIAELMSAQGIDRAIV
jgi:RNA polymerase sigma-70 factor, ECF subfamily